MRGGSGRGWGGWHKDQGNSIASERVEEVRKLRRVFEPKVGDAGPHTLHFCAMAAWIPAHTNGESSPPGWTRIWDTAGDLAPHKVV